MTLMMELVDKNTKTISHMFKNLEERVNMKSKDMEDILKDPTQTFRDGKYNI